MAYSNEDITRILLDEENPQQGKHIRAIVMAGYIDKIPLPYIVEYIEMIPDEFLISRIMPIIDTMPVTELNQILYFVVISKKYRAADWILSNGGDVYAKKMKKVIKMMPIVRNEKYESYVPYFTKIEEDNFIVCYGDIKMREIFRHHGFDIEKHKHNFTPDLWLSIFTDINIGVIQKYPELKKLIQYYNIEELLRLIQDIDNVDKHPMIFAVMHYSIKFIKELIAVNCVLPSIITDIRQMDIYKKPLIESYGSINDNINFLVANGFE